MVRFDLTDEEWTIIASLLPKGQPRQVLVGIHVNLTLRFRRMRL